MPSTHADAEVGTGRTPRLGQLTERPLVSAHQRGRVGTEAPCWPRACSCGNGRHGDRTAADPLIGEPVTNDSEPLPRPSAATIEPVAVHEEVDRCAVSSASLRRAVTRGVACEAEIAQGRGAVGCGFAGRWGRLPTGRRLRRIVEGRRRGKLVGGHTQRRCAASAREPDLPSTATGTHLHSIVAGAERQRRIAARHGHDDHRQQHASTSPRWRCGDGCVGREDPHACCIGIAASRDEVPQPVEESPDGERSRHGRRIPIVLGDARRRPRRAGRALLRLIGLRRGHGQQAQRRHAWSRRSMQTREPRRAARPCW